MRPRIILSLAGLVAVGIAIVLLFRGSQPERDRLEGVREPEAEERQTGQSETRAQSVNKIAPTASDIRGDAEVGIPESRGDVDRDHDLHGRVVDPNDAGVPGARVEVRRNASREYSMLDLEYMKEDRLIGETTTDRQGGFRVRIPQGRKCDLVVKALGYPKTTVRDRYAGEDVLVKLAPGAEYRGRVTRAGDGLPVSGAAMRAWRRADQTPIFAGETDSSGAFAFKDLEPGMVYVEIVPKIERGPGWKEVLLAPGAVVEANFVLEEGHTVSGRVTDAETGAPIADAEVGESWVFRRPVRTGPDGRYVFPGYGATGNGDLHARAKGYGRSAKAVGTKPPLAPVVDFALVRGRAAKGRLLQQTGDPLAGVYVAAAASGYIRGEQATDWPSSRSGDDGSFEIRDLRRDLTHVLCIRKEGFGTAVYDFPAREAESEVIDLGEIVVLPAGSVSGVVVDERSRPLGGVTLRLRGMNADRTRWASDARGGGKQPMSGFHYLSGQSARSDDLGRFRMTDLSPGTYELQQEASRGPQSPPAVTVEVRAGSETAGLTLVVPTKLSIKGRVVNPDGQPVVGAVVSATKEGSPRGNPQSSSMTPPDGVFEIEGLDEGSYALSARVVSYSNAQTPVVRLASVMIPGVIAGKRDMRIVLPRSVPITGTVIDADGKPIEDALVGAIEQTSEARVADARAAADGSFSLDVKEGDVVRVQAQAPNYGEGRKVQGWYGKAVEVPAVAAGTGSLVLVIPKGK